MNVKGWRRLTENREVWKIVVKEANTQPGLQRQKKIMTSILKIYVGALGHVLFIFKAT
ncbi:hypothetical protein C0J52_22525 [Blattella germanica]|nr:hypothetical protein C0J52_22525 [Blattella germanica]